MSGGVLLDDPSQARTFGPSRDITFTWDDAYESTWTRAKARATSFGMSTAHEYLAYRTALRADYAASLVVPARPPATYLPLLNAFRSSVPTAEVAT